VSNLLCEIVIAVLSGSVPLTKYFSGDQIKKNEWAGLVANMRDKRGEYRVLAGRPEGQRPL
jgi:hypothetical protein